MLSGRVGENGRELAAAPALDEVECSGFLDFVREQLDGGWEVVRVIALGFGVELGGGRREHFMTAQGKRADQGADVAEENGRTAGKGEAGSFQMTLSPAGPSPASWAAR